LSGSDKEEVSSSNENGARVEKVDEPRALFIFELEAYPEAKILSSNELKALYQEFNSSFKVASIVVASEAFVRHSCQKKNYKKTKN